MACAAIECCAWKPSSTTCRKTAFRMLGTTFFLICRSLSSPPLHPGTQKPLGPDDLAPLFPMSLILQEMSGEREIEIPEPVRQIYAQWRPSPLFRARRLEKALDTPARIYYKYEGVSPAGSHKLEHRRGAGLLQQGGRAQADLNRDRARGSGDRRSRWRARSSASSARCSWCG